jgi:hypothetical protein
MRTHQKAKEDKRNLLLEPTFLARQVVHAIQVLLAQASQHRKSSKSIAHTINWPSALLSCNVRRRGGLRRVHRCIRIVARIVASSAKAGDSRGRRAGQSPDLRQNMTCCKPRIGSQYVAWHSGHAVLGRGVGMRISTG